jgi:phospholipid/cholesterol/gamma-HCH transport system ATP-binding protein
MPPESAPTNPPGSSPDGPILPVEIRVEALRRAFGSHVVLDGIDLEVRSGDIVAIVGASGSGKTVLLDHIIGLLEPDSGRVLVADHDEPGAPLVDINRIDPDRLDRIRLHWAVVFQKNALFSGTVYDNIALWLREHTDMSERQIRRRAIESIRAVELDERQDLEKDRESLSGGMAKRVAIARAIAVDPLVLFYDEPTTGLDPVVSGHIHELIWTTHNSEVRSLPGVRRTTVIVTHDKELLRRISPRVVMLDGGRVAFDGSYEAFAASELRSAQAYLQAMPVLHARPVNSGYGGS